ncbi:MAG: cytochrome c oxidase subunit [bacterium]|nr:cytochrome c oxidase subunit [bacterium]
MSAPAVAESAAREPVARFGMWVFLVTDAMAFGALLLAYALLRARAEAWPDVAARVHLPLPALATVLLLVSSLTLARGRVVATNALGGAFVGLQAFEWIALGRHGVGFAADRAASSFFVLTGWHGLHVLVGLLLLAVAGARKPVALFWQFVDAVWIVLFTVFYLAPRAHGAAVAALALAAAAGFAAVIAFAMNLRGEPRAVKVMFVLPFAFPVLFLVALVADALAGGIRP